ncbi:MAG: SDR family NAD(P)-dependent oxidoreductase, partial [Desulfobacterales bacterium]|nr:SDR family NAD(P)-dependent oxidoreductase [Desulfobacterales bacterium]
MTDIPTERTAIVTGASKGIGRAICIELAKNGYHTVVNYKSDEKGALKT